MREQEVSLADLLGILIKWRWRIFVGTCLFTALGWVISLSLPSVYRATLYMTVGKVWDKSIENPFRVVEVMNSDSFLERVRDELSHDNLSAPLEKRSSVHAETIVRGPNLEDSLPILLKVSGDSTSPEQAVLMATTSAELIIRDHRTLFDELMDGNIKYEQALGKQLSLLQTDKSKDGSFELQNDPEKSSAEMPKGIPWDPRKMSREKLLQWMNEYREVYSRNHSQAWTQTTRVSIPPTVPIRPWRPLVTLNVIVSGILGFISLLMISFFVEFGLRDKNTPSPD